MADKLREAGSMTRALAEAISHGEAGLKSVPGLLLKIINDGLWQDRIILTTNKRQQFERFVEFVTTPPLEGLGEDLETLRHLCAGNQAALDALDDVLEQEKEQGARTDLLYNVQEVSAPTGNTAAAALRRLRKDAPELHKQVIQGIISPHRAMVQAGFRKRTRSIPADDPVQAARSLARAFDTDQLLQLIDELTRYLVGAPDGLDSL